MFSSALVLRTVALLLALAAFICLIFALFSPFIQIKKLYFFSNEPALFAAFWQLAQDGQWLVAAVLIVATMVLPICKILLYVQGVFVQTPNHRLFNYLQVISKWAMLDVLVVAMLLVSVKLGALAQVEIKSGFYYFVWSLLCSYSLHFVVQRYRKITYAETV